MPLHKGMTMGQAMHDLKHGPHHKDRTRPQEIAIAEKYSGGKTGRRSKHARSRKRG